MVDIQHFVWVDIYDLRSFEKDFGLTNFSTTSMTLSFGTLGASPVTIVHSGDISSSSGFIQLSNSMATNDRILQKKCNQGETSVGNLYSQIIIY